MPQSPHFPALLLGYQSLQNVPSEITLQSVTGEALAFQKSSPNAPTLEIKW